MTDEPDKARKPRVFDPRTALHTQDVPDSLVGKWLYFTGLDKLEIYQDLNHKLVLVKEDFKLDDISDNRRMLRGYVLNTPLKAHFRTHFAQAVSHFAPELRFMPIMNSNIEGFQTGEFPFITFITENIETPTRALKPVFEKFSPIKEAFGQFAAYTCQTIEDAENTAPYINGRKKVLAVDGEFTIGLPEIEAGIRNQKILLADATVENVFYPDIEKRVSVIFPDIKPT